MQHALALIATVSLAVLGSSACIAQEPPTNEPLEMSREDWRAQVKISRERAELMRRERRGFISQAPDPHEIAKEVSKRVLEDDSLIPGDIVSTNRGMFRFLGSRDGERRREDFVRIR